ncbi:2174_t:CDS:2 [Scutellospora calospora]|uniref:2174_t:CDS:1 n=1 Tax=Scutellospora calospora TaxID=85575 RepID=A0ACA9L7Z0_9GLOM|nr:2174_t:CDS:2 [Scutellospora calospora]
MQSFLKTPNFDTHFFYKSPSDLYQEFSNTYAYYKQAIHCNPTPNKQKLLIETCAAWKKIRNENKTFIRKKIQLYLTIVPHTIRSYNSLINSNSTSISVLVRTSEQLSNNISITAKNAVRQNDAITKIKEATQQISEYEQVFRLINDQELGKLKRHAEAQEKLRKKKQKQLDEEGIIEQYDKSGQPLAAILDSDIWDKIHDCVEFRSAHAKRQKTIIKVPHRHHYPAKVSLASVSRTDMKQHIDEHYCLASIKVAQIFAEVFASDTVVISQDDKAKISLGIPAVGRMFKTIQSVNEPVTTEDHDFPKGNKMKLVLLIYLLIDPTNSNTTLRTGKLAIFIKPEYFISTSSLTHITDLLNLPDENPKHFKNIIEYCNLFQTLDLDYLIVRTHAPYQSAYNSVECSMASLLGKLAGITLPVDEYGVHLDSKGNVLNKELARYNFKFLGKKLCDIWSRDNIYDKPVTVQYVDKSSQPFDNIKSTT